MGKRTLKTDIKFDIQLNDEQKEVYDKIKENDITVILGKPGSGKTLCGVMFALNELFVNDVDMIISRPTVSNEDLGFLPGNLQEKTEPWMSPIYHNINICYGSTESKKKTIENHKKREKINIAPISFMRGTTFLNSTIIIDEAQNLTKDQINMVISRLGINSKMIICGDTSQIDLKRKTDSGLYNLIKVGEKVEGFGVYTLFKNHRHPIVTSMLEELDLLEENNK